MVYRGMSQCWRHGRTECDGYQKGEHSIAFCQMYPSAKHGDRCKAKFWFWFGICNSVLGSLLASGGSIPLHSLRETLTYHVTTGARKRPRSFCQKCRWQVTAKYACTLRMWLCMKWHGVWFYGVHRMRRDGSSFMWHQPCQRCKHTTSVDIQKTLYKKLFPHVELHVSAVSLLKSRE